MGYRNDYDDLLRDIEASGQSWSEWDRQLAQENPDVGRSLYQAKLDYANATTDAERRAANQAAEMLRMQYGRYKGGDDGSGYHVYRDEPQYQPPTLPDVKPNYAPQYQEYVSKYAPQIQAMLEKIQGRDPFSYNPQADVTYQAIAEGNRRAGNQARQNAMGEAAAMTGGQVNSAAMAAAMLAENNFNARTSDTIPALKQAAYNMYIGDLNQQRADLNDLIGLDQIGYNRHKDSYNAEFGKWQADYGVDRDIRNDRYQLEQQAYDRWRDQIADSRFADSTEWERAFQHAQIMAQAGDYSGFAKLGFSQAEIERLTQAAIKPVRGGNPKDDDEKLNLGKMSEDDIRIWVQRMLDNSSGRNPHYLTMIKDSDLTADQKKYAEEILNAYLQAGYQGGR